MHLYEWIQWNQKLGKKSIKYRKPCQMWSLYQILIECYYSITYRNTYCLITNCPNSQISVYSGSTDALSVFGNGNALLIALRIGADGVKQRDVELYFFWRCPGRFRLVIDDASIPYALHVINWNTVIYNITKCYHLSRSLLYNNINSFADQSGLKNYNYLFFDEWFLRSMNVFEFLNNKWSEYFSKYSSWE